MIRSKFLEKQGRTEMGRELLISLGFPPLKNGVTQAIFKVSGKTAFSMDFSNRYLTGSSNALKQFSIISEHILS